MYFIRLRCPEDVRLKTRKEVTCTLPFHIRWDCGILDTSQSTSDKMCIVNLVPCVYGDTYVFLFDGPIYRSAIVVLERDFHSQSCNPISVRLPGNQYFFLRVIFLISHTSVFYSQTGYCKHFFSEQLLPSHHLASFVIDFHKITNSFPESILQWISCFRRVNSSVCVSSVT